MTSNVVIPSDEQLAERTRKGEPDCFGELFKRHSKRVYSACYRFFGIPQAAEDATQETFLRAYKNISGFSEGDFSSWLMRIARNVCIDEWRRRRLETSIEEVDPAFTLGAATVDGSYEARMLARRVWHELNDLAADQRRCLVLKIQGFSYEETALQTGLTLKAVKSHIQNGRRMLWRRVSGDIKEERLKAAGV